MQVLEPSAESLLEIDNEPVVGAVATPLIASLLDAEPSDGALVVVDTDGGIRNIKIRQSFGERSGCRERRVRGKPFDAFRSTRPAGIP